MKKLIHNLLVISLFIAGTAISKGDHLSDRLTFSARLVPFPGVTTNGNGVAAFMLNSTHDTLYFTISFARTTSAVNGCHIHNARTGGNVVIDFDGKLLGNSVRSYLTGATLASLWADFMEGNLYVAVHTVTNPAVELFGTVKLETDWGYAASINGAQAGTPSSAAGHAAINFGMKGDTATVRVVTNMGNKITGAHLHFGKPGQSGGIALHFEDLIMGDSVSLLGGVKITPAEWTALQTALMTDSIYINLHTAAYPGGEIRGQVRSSKTLRFDAWINTAAVEVGGGMLNKPSAAYGVSTLWLNNTMDSLYYNVMFRYLSSAASASHFHMGDPNVSGSVVKEVTITGNTISGVWTKSDATNPLDANMIRALLEGSLYLVVHTDSNPGGEIRGQVYRLAREGFIAELNGAQATTSSGAQGTAVASYDRDRTNLHCMVVADGLTGTLNSGHIHFGKRGESGAVAIGLDPFTNNGSYVFANGANGFNNATSVAMRRNDSTYINLHTSTFANGEIRGQLMRYYRISSATVDTSTGIESLVNEGSLKMYPNPVNNRFNIYFDSKVSGETQLVLYNISGSEVLKLETKLTKGSNELQADLSDMKPGIYIAEILINGEVVSHSKLIKQ